MTGNLRLVPGTYPRKVKRAGGPILDFQNPKIKAISIGNASVCDDNTKTQALHTRQVFFLTFIIIAML